VFSKVLAPAAISQLVNQEPLQQKNEAMTRRLSLSVVAEDCSGALPKKRIEPQDKMGV
jgi:hypothetical protein